MTSANDAKEYLGNTKKRNQFQLLDKLAYTKAPFLLPRGPTMQANKRRQFYQANQYVSDPATEK